MSIKKTVLDAVTRFYLGSHDFIGMPIQTILTDLALGPSAAQRALRVLLQEGMVSLNFGERHPNPHIKALEPGPKDEQMGTMTAWFQDKGDVAEQAMIYPVPDNAEITEIKAVFEPPSFCVYPTPLHLEAVVDRREYEGRPYTLRLALGAPQLSFQCFDLSILEAYRNDPRYYYRNDDTHGRIYVASDYHAHMPEQDKAFLETFGIAYDESFNRAIAVFLRYLRDLTPEHQQAWRVKEVTGDYRLHPDYFRANVLGDWPEGVSSLEAILGQIRYINRLCEVIGRPPLFNNEVGEDDRPNDFTFLIRPTLREFNGFVHTLDKLLSDSISRDFFGKDLAFEREQVRKDGKTVVSQKGTIQVLDEWLAAKYKVDDRTPIDEMIATLKEVRTLRNKPAHSLKENIFDQQYFHQQRDLARKVLEALRTLAQILAQHPKARKKPPTDPMASLKVWAY